MSEVFRVLGQAAPAANTDANLLTVAASRAVITSSIFVCNRGTAAGTFRIAVRPAGVAIASQHFLFFDVSLAANSSMTVVAGITLAATDIVTVRASTADFSFSLFGSEVTV